jgi:hypothetical protein
LDQPTQSVVRTVTYVRNTNMIFTHLGHIRELRERVIFWPALQGKFKFKSKCGIRRSLTVAKALAAQSSRSRPAIVLAQGRTEAPVPGRAEGAVSRLSPALPVLSWCISEPDSVHGGEVLKSEQPSHEHREFCRAGISRPRRPSMVTGET